MALGSRGRGAGLRMTVVAAVVAAISVVPGVASAETVQEMPDQTMYRVDRALDDAEVAAADITDSVQGLAALLQAADEGLEIYSSVFRVYVFGEYSKYIVPSTTPFTVYTGVNAYGDPVFDLVVHSGPTGDITASAGLAPPPSSQWKYNNDGSFAQTVGSWYRVIWWTLTFADNYRTCSTCTAYDFWRVHGKMRASAVTGSTSSEGFKRAWLEFRRSSGKWSSVGMASFEADQPEESYAGTANQTTTVGFGTSYSVNLGVPPLTATGGYNTSYGGSMTKSSENWHPVIRTTIGNGGVQWCRYESPEFTGTKIVSTRQSARTNFNSGGGWWDILTGQQDYTSYCPSQI